MLRLRTILVPADFSLCSQRAFHLACALARDYGARLVLLHVATPPPFVTPGEMQRAMESPTGYRAVLENQLRQRYAANLGAGIEYRVIEGEPVSEIVYAAQQLSCDAIVIGTHGRTGLDRLLMGSIAEKIVRTAPCPVVAVKAPPAETSLSVLSVPLQSQATA